LAAPKSEPPPEEAERRACVYTVRDGNRDYRTVQFCCWQ